MKIIGRCIVAQALALILTACATTLSDRASRIRIITAAEAKQHEYIGLIQGSSGYSGAFRNVGYQNALNHVLEIAAAKGAEFIVVDPRSQPTFWTAGQIVQAEAFRRK